VKLNGRSSTEAELIGIDDALPCIMWGLSFSMNHLSSLYDIRELMCEDGCFAIMQAL